MPNRDWFQIFTNIGVIAGIAILVFELNQANTHMLAQLADSNFQMSYEQELMLLGERPAPVIAKACTDSRSLTREEKVILDAFHSSIYSVLEHRLVMHRLGIFRDDWKVVATNFAERFAHPAGVEWWKTRKPYAHKDLIDVIENAISRGDSAYTICNLYGNASGEEDAV